MMDKAKSKQAPINTRRYWLILGLLAIVLLIPFRLMEYWLLTNAIYLVISVMIAVSILHFVSRYGWKQWVIIPMLICVLLPIFQVSINRQWAFCEYNSGQSIIRPVRCSEGCDTNSHMLAVGSLPLSIQSYFGRYVPYCLT